jgi:hypothetical protein
VPAGPKKQGLGPEQTKIPWVFCFPPVSLATGNFAIPGNCKWLCCKTFRQKKPLPEEKGNGKLAN